MVRLLDQSPLRAAVFTTEVEPLTGTPIALSAAVFDGATPVAGASVPARIFAPDPTETSLVLLDNGNPADFAAGDGLYSGTFVPQQSGEHIVVAEITGQTASGVPFVRAVSTSFVVAGGCGRLTAPLTDYGNDTNGDGRLDGRRRNRSLTVAARKATSRGLKPRGSLKRPSVVSHKKPIVCCPIHSSVFGLRASTRAEATRLA